MALSMHEQRMLEEIEQRLSDDDPRLASVFSRFSAAQRRLVGFRRERSAVVSSVSYLPKRQAAPVDVSARHRWVPWAVLALGTAVLIGGVITGQVAIALAGSLLVAATPLLIPVCTRPRFRRTPAPDVDDAVRRAWWQRVRPSRHRSRTFS